MSIQVTSDGEGLYILSSPDQSQWVEQVDLAGAIREAVAGKTLRGLILDLDGVSFINSAGLGAIFALRRYAAEAGARVVVSRPMLTILRLLNTVNLPELIPVTSTLEEARLALAAAAPAAES